MYFHNIPTSEPAKKKKLSVVGSACWGREGMKARKLEGLKFWFKKFLYSFFACLKVKIGHNPAKPLTWAMSCRAVKHSLCLFLCVCSPFSPAAPQQSLHSCLLPLGGWTWGRSTAEDLMGKGENPSYTWCWVLAFSFGVCNLWLLLAVLKLESNTIMTVPIYFCPTF